MSDVMGKSIGPMAILKEFFGYKTGQGLREFGEEVKKLSPEEKDWMVSEAAKMLGVTVKVM